jgi:plastocyanin
MRVRSDVAWTLALGEMHMRGQSLLAGLGLVTLLSSCGGGSDSTAGPTDGEGNTVTVGNNFFSPVDLSVAAGTTVTWSWAAGAVDHNVTFDDGAQSPTQSSGSFPRTFSAAGTFPYHCTIHAALGMRGTVTVAGSSGGGGGSGMGGGGSGGGGSGGGGYDY